jgi:hypothetical protein
MTAIRTAKLGPRRTGLTRIGVPEGPGQEQPSIVVAVLGIADFERTAVMPVGYASAALRRDDEQPNNAERGSRLRASSISQRSRNARMTWSCIGLTKYDSTVRSSV